jgi:hypothetical protein
MPTFDLLPTREQSLAERYGYSVTATMAMGSWPFEVRYVDRTLWDERASPP